MPITVKMWPSWHVARCGCGRLKNRLGGRGTREGWAVVVVVVGHPAGVFTVSRVRVVVTWVGGGGGGGSSGGGGGSGSSDSSQGDSGKVGSDSSLSFCRDFMKI